MSERGNGSQMDYLELKRMHDRYKSKQRMANLANKKPQPAAEAAEETRAAAPIAVPRATVVPEVVGEEAPRRGPQADSVSPADVEAAEELELGGDQDVGEEVYDTGEPDEAPAAGLLSDSQNPFNQFFVAFGKMKDKMAERKAKKAALEEEPGAADEIPAEDVEGGDPGDPELEDLGEGAFEDEEQGGVLGKITGAFKKFSFGKKKEDDLDLDDLSDEELEDLYFDEDEPVDESVEAEEEPAEEPAAVAESAAEDFVADVDSEPVNVDSGDEYEADSGDYDPADDDDFDYDDEEDEVPRKKRGLKDVFSLFVRREEKEPEPEEEAVEDDFSFDFDVFGEQFQPVMADEQPVIPKGDDTVEETTEKTVRVEENPVAKEAEEIMTAGMSRRERRELAMKKAQEEAARLETALAAAEAEEEAPVKVEPVVAAPVVAEPVAEAPAADEQPKEEVREVTPSIFDDPVTDDIMIAQVDEPTREFRPVHMAAAVEQMALFSDEDADDEEQEEEKPTKKGLFGRKKANKVIEEEDDEEEEKPAKKSRRSRRDEEEDEEEEAPRRRRSRYEDEDEDDEDEYESRRSRRDRRRRSREEEEDEYDEYESRRSQRRDYDDEEDDDIDYDNYDYNDDDGAGHGFLYHLSGFLKAVTVFVIVLLVIVIGLNVWEFIGNKNGSDSPVDTLSEHLRDYAPGVFDVLFPVAEDAPAADDAADEPVDLGDGSIELGEGWDTTEDEGEATETEGEPELVG